MSTTNVHDLKLTASHNHIRTLCKHSKNDIDALVNKQTSAHVDSHVRLIRY